MLQLVYASAATSPFTPEALKELLRRARERNRLYAVSGMLLYHNGSFLQVLEGPQAGVETIFRSIERDPRHHRTRILHRQPLTQREFPDWSMGFVDTSSSPFDLKPAGLIDYNTAMSTLTLGDTRARQYLRFFHQGLCRQ